MNGVICLDGQRSRALGPRTMDFDLLRRYGNIHLLGFLEHNPADVIITLAAVRGGERFCVEGVLKLVVIKLGWNDCDADAYQPYNERNSENHFYRAHSMVRRPGTPNS